MTANCVRCGIEYEYEELYKTLCPPCLYHNWQFALTRNRTLRRQIALLRSQMRAIKGMNRKARRE